MYTSSHIFSYAIQTITLTILLVHIKTLTTTLTQHNKALNSVYLFQITNITGRLIIIVRWLAVTQLSLQASANLVKYT